MKTNSMKLKHICKIDSIINYDKLYVHQINLNDLRWKYNLTPCTRKM